MIRLGSTSDPIKTLPSSVSVQHNDARCIFSPTLTCVVPVQIAHRHPMRSGNLQPSGHTIMVRGLDRTYEQFPGRTPIKVKPLAERLCR